MSKEVFTVRLQEKHAWVKRGRSSDRLLFALKNNVACPEKN